MGVYELSGSEHVLFDSLRNIENERRGERHLFVEEFFSREKEVRIRIRRGRNDSSSHFHLKVLGLDLRLWRIETGWYAVKQSFFRFT